MLVLAFEGCKSGATTQGAGVGGEEEAAPAPCGKSFGEGSPVAGSGAQGGHVGGRGAPRMWQVNGCPRLLVCGEAFWASAGEAIGTSLAIVARSMMPLRLADNQLPLAPLNNQCSAPAPEVKFEVSFELPFQKRTLVKKLQKLAATNHNFVLQLQCRSASEGVGGEETVTDAVLCAVQMNSEKLMQALETGEAMSGDDAITITRSSRPGQESFRFLVVAELGELLLDAGHLALAVLTLINPVRFLMLLMLLFEGKEQWQRRVDEKLLSGSEYLRDTLEEGMRKVCMMLNESAKRRHVPCPELPCLDPQKPYLKVNQPDAMREYLASMKLLKNLRASSTRKLALYRLQADMSRFYYHALQHASAHTSVSKKRVAGDEAADKELEGEHVEITFVEEDSEAEVTFVENSDDKVTFVEENSDTMVEENSEPRCVMMCGEAFGETRDAEHQICDPEDVAADPEGSGAWRGPGKMSDEDTANRLFAAVTEAPDAAASAASPASAEPSTPQGAMSSDDVRAGKEQREMESDDAKRLFVLGTQAHQAGDELRANVKAARTLLADGAGKYEVEAFLHAHLAATRSEENSQRGHKELLKCREQIQREIASAKKCSAPGVFTRELSETRLIVRAMCTSALTDAVGLFLLLLLMLTGYRLPVTLRKMWRADSLLWRKKILAQQCIELLRDGVLLLESLVIICSLYRAFSFVGELSGIVQRYPEPIRKLRACGHETLKALVLQDLKWLLTIPLRPKTWKLCLATCFCVLVGPADMAAQSMASIVQKKYIRVPLALLLSWVLLAWPFATFYILETHAERQRSVGIFWCVLLAFLIVSTSAALRVPEQYLSRRIINPATSVAFSGPNALAILSIPLDALQLMALMLSSLQKALASQGLEAQSGNIAMNSDAAKLHEAVDFMSRVKDVVFLTVWSGDDFLWWVWAVAVSTLVSLLIVLSPVARLMIYNKQKEEVISGYEIYKSVVTLSTHTLSVFVVETLASAIDCTEDAQGGHQHPGVGDEPFHLREHPTVECWTGRHRPLFVFAMTVLSLYVTVSQMMGVYFGRIKVQRQEGLDIRYSQAYMHVSNGVKLMFVAALHALPTPLAFVICSVAIVAMLGAYTAFFKVFHSRLAAQEEVCVEAFDDKPTQSGADSLALDQVKVVPESSEEVAACSIPWVLSLRVGMVCAAVAWTGICCIAALTLLRASKNDDGAGEDGNSKMQLLGMTFLVGLGAVLAATGLHSLMVQRSWSNMRRAAKAKGIAHARLAYEKLVRASTRQETWVSGFDVNRWLAAVAKTRQVSLQ